MRGHGLGGRVFDDADLAVRGEVLLRVPAGDLESLLLQGRRGSFTFPTPTRSSRVSLSITLSSGTHADVETVPPTFSSSLRILRSASDGLMRIEKPYRNSRPFITLLMPKLNLADGTVRPSSVFTSAGIVPMRTPAPSYTSVSGATSHSRSFSLFIGLGLSTRLDSRFSRSSGSVARRPFNSLP